MDTWILCTYRVCFINRHQIVLITYCSTYGVIVRGHGCKNVTVGVLLEVVEKQ